MTAKIEVSNLDNLIRRYEAGEPIKKLAHEEQVTTKTMWRRLREAGVTIRRDRVIVADLDSLLARYIAGESEKTLAAEAGISRRAFRLRLDRAGILARGRSEAELAKWASMGPERRAAQVAAANDATRGRVRTWDERRRGALTREHRLTCATAVETMLADALRVRGLTVTQQKAIGVYNIDVAIHEPAIAVEVYGGYWHSTENSRWHHLKRSKYLLNLGWHLVIIWIDVGNYPLGIGAYEYVASFAESARLDPAGRGEYRVIFGNGKPASAARSYLNSPAIIEALYASD